MLLWNTVALLLPFLPAVLVLIGLAVLQLINP
jgi:hypothetical protein